MREQPKRRLCLCHLLDYASCRARLCARDCRIAPEGGRRYLRPEEANAALEAALRDEPHWAGLFRVEEIELDERDVSAN